MTKPSAADIDALLEGKQVVPSLLSQLPALVERFGAGRITIAAPLVAVIHSERSEYGGSGGIGYFSQVTVVCGQATEMKEWQYRDRYDASRDAWHLAVHSIGEVKVKRDGTTVTVDVELKNNREGSRHATWTFTGSKESTATPALDEAAQEAFRATFQATAEAELARLNEMHALKNPMVSRHGGHYTSYQQPRIKQQLVRADLGIASTIRRCGTARSSWARTDPPRRLRRTTRTNAAKGQPSSRSSTSAPAASP